MSKYKPFDRAKDKSRWFRTNTHDPDCIENLKLHCRSFDRWFYIMHTADDECDSEHLHLVVMRSPALIKNVARKLDIPENFVQPSFDHEHDIRYLIHLDNPEKKQYSPDDVVCSHPGIFKSCLIDTNRDDVNDLFDDLRRLSSGKLALDEFNELHYKELQTMPFYQKIKTFEYLNKISVKLTQAHT